MCREGNMKVAVLVAEEYHTRSRLGVAFTRIAAQGPWDIHSLKIDYVLRNHPTSTIAFVCNTLRQLRIAIAGMNLRVPGRFRYQIDQAARDQVCPHCPECLICHVNALNADL